MKNMGMWIFAGVVGAVIIVYKVKTQVAAPVVKAVITDSPLYATAGGSTPNHTITDMGDFQKVLDEMNLTGELVFT